VLYFWAVRRRKPVEASKVSPTLSGGPLSSVIRVVDATEVLVKAPKPVKASKYQKRKDQANNVPDASKENVAPKPANKQRKNLSQSKLPKGSGMPVVDSVLGCGQAEVDDDTVRSLFVVVDHLFTHLRLSS
jgi:hypothetical protein